MIHVGYILMEKKFSDIWTPNTIQMHFTLLVLALPLIWHWPQSKHHLFLLNLAWIWHCQIWFGSCMFTNQIGPQCQNSNQTWRTHFGKAVHIWLEEKQKIMGGTTPNTHGKLHGLHSQGRSSPQDKALWSTALLGVPRKTPGRYPEDTTRSVRIRSIPWFM